MSEAEETFAMQLKADGIPVMEREMKFHPTRRWKFDFAFPAKLVAVEIEGGSWVAGRHNRGSGFEKDLEKYNAATLLGWKVYRFTTSMVNDGTAVAMIAEALGRCPGGKR